jgi:hypothetical protein
MSDSTREEHCGGCLTFAFLNCFDRQSAEAQRAFSDFTRLRSSSALLRSRSVSRAGAEPPQTGILKTSCTS